MKTTRINFIKFMFVGLLSFCSLTPIIYGQDYKKLTDCQIKSLRQNDSTTSIGLAKLTTRIDYMEKSQDARFDVLLKVLAVIVSMLIIIVGAGSIGTYIKGKATAEETAKTEAARQFKVSFKEYHKRIKAMEAEAKATLERIKGYESSILSINDNLKTIDTPTLDKISSLLDMFKSTNK